MKHAFSWVKGLVIITLFVLFPRTFGLDAAPVHNPEWIMNFWQALGEPKDGQIVGREFSARTGVSIGGPLLPGSRLVHNPSTGSYLAADPHFVLVYNTAWFAARLFPLPGADQPNPDISWPMGITYDGVRRKPVVVTLGGEGHLLALDESDGSWQVIRSLGGRDFDSITYKDFDNVFFGVETSGGGELVVTSLAANGEFLRSYRIPNVPFTVGPGNYRSEIIAFPAQLVVVLEAPRNSIPSPESRIYVIDLTTGQAELTYRKEWASWPPAAKPPIIAMQPAPGPYRPGDWIGLKAQGKAEDGARIARVDFHANGQLLGRGFETGTIGPLNEQVFTYTWSNSVAGRFSVTATATDSRGLVATSLPSQVVIGEDQPNQRPAVRITLPASGSQFDPDEVVHVTVEAKDPDGRVQSVEFLANGQSIGFGHEALPFAPIDGQLFSFTWENPPPGEIQLVARARDDKGATADSDPVLFFVEHPPAPSAFFTLRYLEQRVSDPRLFEARFSTNSGPDDGGAFIRGVRMVGDGRYLFGAEPHNIYRYDRELKRTTEVSLPSHDVSWPMGAAFDHTRGIVYIVTLGGDGALLSYTYATETWQHVRSMENRDFDSITYHAATDTLWGVENSYASTGPTTVRLTPIPLSGSYGESVVLREVPFTVGHSDRSEMVSVGNRQYLLLEGAHDQGSYESRMYLIDPDTRTSALILRKEWSGQPGNNPPTVNVVAPENGSVHTVGSTITLRARANDSDGQVRSVTFYDGIVSLGSGIVETMPAGEEGLRFVYHWRHTSLGAHSITAVATDDRGGSSTSAPVRITAVQQAAVLRIASPMPGTNFTVGATIPLSATLEATDYERVSVSFYEGDRLIGAGKRISTLPIYSLAWTNVPVGPHTIVARATGAGVAISSDPVTFTVSERSGLSVQLTAPVAGSVHTNTRPVPLRAEAVSQSNIITSLEFYAGDRLIASRTWDPRVILVALPHKVVVEAQWTNPPVGEHRIVAKVRDTSGALVESNARNIRVLAGASNQPPIVTIVSPANGARHTNSHPITLVASAYDPEPNSAIGDVVFYANGQRLGEGRRSALAIFPPQYAFTWERPPLGEHLLTATAVDSSGAVTTSTPVHLQVVSVNNEPTNRLIRVTRALPESYIPGQSFIVRLNVAAMPGVKAYAVEDQPPFGWRVQNLSHDGVFDPSTGKAKFGPFIDSQSRTLTYLVSAPSTNGFYLFAGTASANGVSSPIEGDQGITTGSDRHPADVAPSDNAIRLDELSAYAADWSRTARATSVSYLTRAALLWKSGETYRFDPSAEPPLCWVPDRDLSALAEENESSASVASRTLTQASVSGFVDVAVTVDASDDVAAYAVEERLPAGLTIVAVGNDGMVSPDGTVIRWGPFLDNAPRVLTYQVDATALDTLFVGVVSFDGGMQFVEGEVALTPLSVTASLTADGRTALVFTVGANEIIAVETVQRLGGWWTELERVTGTDGPRTVTVTHHPDGQTGFYRLRRVQ